MYPAQKFPTTHWSVVCAAQSLDEEARGQAIGELYKVYWLPLYAYARHTGCSPDNSEDAVQAFFAKMLESNFIKSANREKGRFRAFLCVGFKRYLKDEYEKATAQKRGGVIIRIDMATAEAILASRSFDTLSPEEVFDREWVYIVLGRVFETLRRQYQQRGQEARFEALKVYLDKSPHDAELQALALQQGTTKGALKTALCRLRASFRLLAQEEIAKTVSSDLQMHPEIKHLSGILREIAGD